MKYFIDTEFIEIPGHIELISIGIVCEDGREYYAENNFDGSYLMDLEDEDLEWMEENVFKNLIGGAKKISTIKKEILNFIGSDNNPEFWGYYADYDWVCFCWIFGRMIDLPKGWPMYCRDLKQMMDFACIDKSDLAFKPSQEHNALSDARWNLMLYDYINTFYQFSVSHE